MWENSGSLWIIFWLSYLCGEVAAELELLERNSHGVGAKEEDEGHEGQVGNILTGVPHQHTAVLHTLFLTQLTPVQVCQVKLQRQDKAGEEGRRVGRGGEERGLREGLVQEWRRSGHEKEKRQAITEEKQYTT